VLGFDHEISSDLEWMLQSGHATPETLLEVLAPEFYPAVYRLAQAWLGDESRARQAAREALVQAVLHVHAYRPERGARAWIFRRAVLANRRLAPRRKSTGRKDTPALADAPSQSDPPLIWQAFDSLPESSRQMLLLYGLSSLSIDETAYVLNLKADVVHRRLKQAVTALGELAGSSAGGIPDAVEMDWLQQRYPQPEISPAELSQAAEWAARQSTGRSLRRRISGRARDVAFTALAVALALAIFWYAGSRLSRDEPAEAPAPAGPTAVPRQSALYLPQAGDNGQVSVGLPGLPAGSPIVSGSDAQPGQSIAIPLDVFTSTQTTVSELPELASPPALSARTDSETIRQRLVESAGLWRTLWLQAEALDYGPAGYVGPPVGYRLQGWVQQPGQSLELAGSLDGQINRVNLVEGGRKYHSLGGATPLYVEAWQEGDPLLQDETLNRLAFPSIGPWMQPGGTFVAVESDTTADRRTLVADWYHPNGERVYRLWLDARTGVLLRVQHYGGGDGLTLLGDVLVTAASFDAVLPEALFDPQTAGLGGFAQDAQGTPLRFALSNELVPQIRPPLPYSPPPQNLDLARSALLFQFPLDLSAASLVSDTQTIPTDLFAGGYFLGQVPFALPWSLTCARSPDGRQVAFATYPTQERASGQLGWFNLSDINQVYFPAPGFSATSLAFSPDGKRLALFGRDGRGVSGIFTLDLATGMLEQILALADARSLVWSPDGRYLALVGKEGANDAESQIIGLNLETQQVIYATPYIAGQPVPTDSSLAAWVGNFPLPDNAYACTQPMP